MYLDSSSDGELLDDLVEAVLGHIAPGEVPADVCDESHAYSSPAARWTAAMNTLHVSRCCVSFLRPAAVSL